MRARYTRIYTDSGGDSSFEGRETELIAAFSLPPAKPLNTAEFLTPQGPTFFLGAAAGWVGEKHPAPRRLRLLQCQGEYEVITTAGTSRRFGPGSILLLDDTTGGGHVTKITSADDCITFAVPLPLA